MRPDLTIDSSTTVTICTSLLGENAVADNKTEKTSATLRRLDAIGYTLDLALQTVTLTRRNLLKTLYAFYSINTSAKVPLAALQRAASLASRYSAILPELLPFSRALHQNARGMRNRRARVTLSEEAKLSIELWRTILCAVAFDEQRLARRFLDFVPREATAVIQFDASLQGLGLLLYERDPATGAERLVGGGVVPLLAWGLDEEDSSNQNLVEFMAIVVGITAALTHMPASATRSVILQGDSVTALRWAEMGRVRSDRAARAAVLLVLLLVRGRVQIVKGRHVLAHENQECDLLSRRDEQGRYRSVQDVIPGARDLKLNECTFVKEALGLCDPRSGTLKPCGFETFWKAAVDWTASLRDGQDGEPTHTDDSTPI
jgi:hypothetical protein